MSHQPPLPDVIPIPEPLQRRILAKNAALQQARKELEELLDLTQELLSVPDGYALYDVSQGFVLLRDDTDRPLTSASESSSGRLDSP